MDTIRLAAASSPPQSYDLSRRPNTSIAPTPQAGYAPDRIDRGMPPSPIVRGVKAAYDRVLGDDIDRAFGRNHSPIERGVGALSLASDVLPIGKIAGLATKGILRLAETIGLRAISRTSDVASASAATHISKTIMRSTVAAYPSLDLRAIEKGVSGAPHTLAEHVDKNVAFLAHRVINEGKKSASSYFDIAVAQRSADALIALPENQKRIGEWVREGMRRNLVLEGIVSKDPVGKVLTRADVAAGRNPTSTNVATLVLKPEIKSPTGYTILTTYPSLLGG